VRLGERRSKVMPHDMRLRKTMQQDHRRSATLRAGEDAPHIGVDPVALETVEEFVAHGGRLVGCAKGLF
jgi:hypothetical protein